MNKKILILIILVLIGVSYYIFSQNIFTKNSSMNNEVASNSDELVPNNTPEGWKNYSNTEWGIAFAYPTNWSILEAGGNQSIRANPEKGEKLSQDQLVGIILEGENYTLSLSRKGRGIGPEGVVYTHPEYIVNGSTARTWENIDKGLFLVVSTDSGCNNISFFVENKNSTSKEVINKILNSVKCKQK